MQPLQMRWLIFTAITSRMYPVLKRSTWARQRAQSARLLTTASLFLPLCALKMQPPSRHGNITKHMTRSKQNLESISNACLSTTYWNNTPPYHFDQLRRGHPSRQIISRMSLENKRETSPRTCQVLFYSESCCGQIR